MTMTARRIIYTKRVVQNREGKVIQIRINETLLEEFRDVSEDEHRTLSEILRQCIVEYIEKKKALK